MKYQKVLSGHRISIPLDLCKKYDIKEGDFIIIEEENNNILIIPAEIRKRI